MVRKWCTVFGIWFKYHSTRRQRQLHKILDYIHPFTYCCPTSCKMAYYYSQLTLDISTLHAHIRTAVSICSSRCQGGYNRETCENIALFGYLLGKHGYIREGYNFSELGSLGGGGYSLSWGV